MNSSYVTNDKYADQGALVILSGGQDSTTCLYWAKQNFLYVEALTFDYNQRHRVELDSAVHIGKYAGVLNHHVMTTGFKFSGDSPLTNPDKSVETYESADVLPGGLEKTFVPGRNILFLTMAASYAYTRNLRNLVIGVSQEDYGGYPDCREVFIDHMQAALQFGLDYPINIHAPLINLDKKQTVELAIQLKDCWAALSYSHTCYSGQVPPCGNCHSCLLRQKGFDLAGMPDPLLVRLQNEGLLTTETSNKVMQ